MHDQRRSSKSRADRDDSDHGAFEARWRARFVEFAEDHEDDAGIAGWSATGLEARLRRFAGLWRCSDRDGRWLDAGCGAGTYVRLLSTHGLTVIGIDYSLPTVRKARMRGEGSGLYAVADVRRLPFRAGTFDGVLCFGVMQALTDSASALVELGNKVRPGGELWVDALNRWCVVNALDLLRRRLRGRAIHLRYESPGNMKRSLRAQGFEAVQVHWMPILPARWQRWQRWLERPLAQRMLAVLPLCGRLLCHAFIVRAVRPCHSVDTAPSL